MSSTALSRVLVATVVLLFLSVTSQLCAENLSAVEGNDLFVKYDEPLKNAAQEVVGLYPRIRDELERVTGWEIDLKPTIFLIKDHETFRKITANPYIIAFAVPAKQLVVIDYSKMNTSPFTLETTLKHEMCHVILGRNIPADRMPRWLNEGFCQWVTGGIAEFMIDGRQPSLSKASLFHQLIPLIQLAGNFPDDRNQLTLAYEESKSVVDYMVTEYGRNSVVSILGYLKEGETIDGAIGKALSITPGELERRWVQYLKGHVTWVGYLAANIYTILLFAAALLTVLGFLRVIVKRRLKKQELDEDDE